MGVTSKKLYNVKNDVLRKDISKIGVSTDEELLRLEAPSQYNEVYRALGVNSKQDFVDIQLKDTRELKVYQDKFANADAFKGHHIKKLCNSYDLMIMPISNVKGYLNDDAMKAVKEFTDAHKSTILSDSSLFILGGREIFYNDFEGKEVKTCIIFYRDKSNNSTTYSRRLDSEHVVNQVFQSGDDFNTMRVFNQLFLTKRYTSGEGMPRLYSNLLISILLCLALLFGFTGHLIIGTVVMVMYLVIMFLNNSVKEYKQSWNGYPETHRYSV